MNSCLRCAVIRKITLVMILLPAMLFMLSTGNKVTAATDTTWSVSFQVNMSKAVKDNIFRPDSDAVYLVLDQGILPLKLVPGPGYNYSGTLYNELDSNKTYHYKFRINDSTWEAVNRSVTPVPGMLNVSVWWNDDPINVTTFRVDMKYAVQYGMFNPSADSVSVIGTMNGFLGSPKMTRADTSLFYTVDYALDPGTVQEYKYRINDGDTATHQLELLYQPNRILRVPDTLLTVSNDFNNYNPAKRLMTFNCNMTYYINTYRFNASSDYLDVAGNFNGGGANDVLFDTDGDSVYTVGMFLDTSYISQPPLSFKFRINGNWSTAELKDKPNRNYAFHDTVNQNPNIFGCWYNDLDPTVPTPPWVYDVAIQGKLIHKQILSGSYSYEDLNGIPEDSTTFRWLRSFDAAGDSVVAIDSAWKITYRVDTLDVGKWLVFEVQPRAAYGDSAVGKPVRVVSATTVGGVGIAELTALISRVYPNPAADQITVEAKREIDLIELFSQSGRRVMTAGGLHTQAVRLQISQLPAGVYLLKATTKSHEWGVVQVVKL
jgi:hypothetical protein